MEVEPDYRDEKNRKAFIYLWKIVTRLEYLPSWIYFIFTLQI